MRRLGRVASATFNCPPEAIQEDTVAADIAGWDSLSHSIFIMNVEGEFDVEFDLALVPTFSSVGDMVTSILELGS